MRHGPVALPDELSTALAAPGQDLSVLPRGLGPSPGTREPQDFGCPSLASCLVTETPRWRVGAFLKNHGVELEYNTGRH